MKRTSIEIRFKLPEAITVRGIGAWSSAGQQRRYWADGVVVTIQPNNTIDVRYTAIRYSSTFTSDDPKLAGVEMQARALAEQMIATGF